MKLFDITLPKNSICTDNSLYYRASKDVIRQENTLVIPKGQKVSFDTFFNCFSYSKYAKYTNLQTVGISLTLKGSFDINLYLIDSDNQKNIVLLSTTTFNSETALEKTLQQPINSLKGQGYIFVELVSKKDDSVFYSGDYFAEDIQVNDVKIALIFCTFRREEFLYRNVNNIKDYLIDNPDLSDKFSIIVADNGNSLDHSIIDGVAIYPNKNLGGSGGFTRGIIETIKNPHITHFLLMDDDIIFDPKILRKTYSILSIAKNTSKLSIGGAMLELDRPRLQYEMGGRSNGLRLFLMKNGIDVGNVHGLLQNEIEEFINYNAWWFMCMPASAIKNGLPLPFFIKGDDVEYGLRFNGDILVINGIGVWHEAFNKKYSGELEYYIKRNELIITSLYFPKVTISKLMRKMIRAIGLRLVYHRYYEADFIVKAYEDFLKGADFLLATDAVDLHAKLRALCPAYLSDEELLAKEKVYFDLDKYNESINNAHKFKKQYLTLNSYLVPKIFYSKVDKKTFRVIDVSNTKPINFYKAIKVLQYNTSLRKGFVTRLKKSELIYAGFKIIKVYILMLFKYKKACRSYKNNHKKLSSIEQWKKMLNL